MYAREWKARCPLHHRDSFIEYLHRTGLKDIAATPGYRGVQIFVRNRADQAEITLISYWDCLQSIRIFAGEDIGIARQYKEDSHYELDADDFVSHYEVVENIWRDER